MEANGETHSSSCPSGTTTSRVFRNVLIGERVRADSQNGKPTLPIAAVFQSFPVALLEQDRPLS